MQTAIAISLIAFCCFLVLPPVAFRIMASINKFILLVLFYAFVTAIVAALPLVLLVEDTTRASTYTVLGVSLFIFFFLWSGYLLFYFMMERSVSVRVLAQMVDNGGSLDVSTIKQMYSFEDVLKRRVDQMVEAKYLVLSQDSKSPGTRSGLYLNSPKGEKLGMLTNLSKRVLQLGEGG